LHLIRRLSTLICRGPRPFFSPVSTQKGRRLPTKRIGGLGGEVKKVGWSPVRGKYPTYDLITDEEQFPEGTTLWIISFARSRAVFEKIVQKINRICDIQQTILIHVCHLKCQGRSPALEKIV
jgi:hypothetical protein